MTESGVIAARRRRRRRRHEQLRDAGIGEPDEADLVAGNPRLRGDGLDDVVAVEQLQRLEEVVGAARAAGAAHVHADGGEAEDGGDERGRIVGRVAQGGHRVAQPLVAGDRLARLRRRVAGVGHHRRVGPFVDGAGQGHVGRERGAVARGDVRGAGQERLRVVEALRRQALGDAEHVQVARPLLSRGGAHDVAVAGRDVAEHEAALRVGDAAGERGARAIVDGELGAGIGVRDVELLDTFTYVKRGIAVAAGGAHEGADDEPGSAHAAHYTLAPRVAATWRGGCARCRRPSRARAPRRARDLRRRRRPPRAASATASRG